MIRAHRLLTPLVVTLAVVIAGCSSTPPRKTSSSTSSGSGPYKGGGGYYKDDGPGANIPDDIDETPDPIPRIEPLASGANRPYTVLGKRYVPITDPNRPYKRTGVASWYGKKFHGNSTSIGESYDMYAMTAAHPTMPLPSYARVTSSVNGRTVIVRVNDRGPFHRGRIMDLSYTAAHKLGLIGGGSGKVTVERILPSEIRLAQSQGKIVTATGMADPNASKVAAVTEAPAPAAGKMSASSRAPAQTVESLVASSGAPTPVEKNVVAEAGAEAEAASSATRIVQTTAPASSASSLRMRELEPAGAVYLQMGAFSQPTNAQALVQRVNSQMDSSTGNVPAVVQQNGSFYRVRLGPYADRITALNAAQQVANRTGILPSLATY